MSYQEKLARVIALLEQYNSQVEDEADKIDIAEFRRRLKNKLGVTELTVSAARWEDIEKCGVPVVLARAMGEIFREKEASPDQDLNYFSEKKAGKMHPLALLQVYNPNAPENPVSKRLYELSKGYRFIVLDSNGQVNAPESHTLLQELINGRQPRAGHAVNGIPVRLYAVGEGKTELVNENPIYPGVALRTGDFDDQLLRSWEPVPQTVRQLVYLAVNKTNELSRAFQNGHSTLDLALEPDAELKIRQRCPKASLLWDDLNTSGDLPKLKVSAKSGPTPNKQNPFGIGRNLTY
jgi:hypothetical protein